MHKIHTFLHDTLKAIFIGLPVIVFMTVCLFLLLGPLSILLSPIIFFFAFIILACACVGIIVGVINKDRLLTTLSILYIIFFFLMYFVTKYYDSQISTNVFLLISTRLAEIIIPVAYVLLTLPSLIKKVKEYSPKKLQWIFIITLFAALIFTLIFIAN